MRAGGTFGPMLSHTLSTDLKFMDHKRKSPWIKVAGHAVQ
jgi:hypothetical protein